MNSIPIDVSLICMLLSSSVTFTHSSSHPRKLNIELPDIGLRICNQDIVLAIDRRRYLCFVPILPQLLDFRIELSVAIRASDIFVERPTKKSKLAGKNYEGVYRTFRGEFMDRKLVQGVKQAIKDAVVVNIHHVGSRSALQRFLYCFHSIVSGLHDRIQGGMSGRTFNSMSLFDRRERGPGLSLANDISATYSHDCANCLRPRRPVGALGGWAFNESCAEHPDRKRNCKNTHISKAATHA